jgi:hypothetical protein
MIISNAQALTLCKGVDWSNGVPTISHDAITINNFDQPCSLLKRCGHGLQVSPVRVCHYVLISI